MAAVFPSVDKQRPRKSHDFGNRFLANQSSKRCFSHSPFHRLQNSPCFCLFKYAQAVLQYATPILRDFCFSVYDIRRHYPLCPSSTNKSQWICLGTLEGTDILSPRGRERIKTPNRRTGRDKWSDYNKLSVNTQPAKPCWPTPPPLPTHTPHILDNLCFSFLMGSFAPRENPRQPPAMFLGCVQRYVSTRFF